MGTTRAFALLLLVGIASGAVQAAPAPKPLAPDEGVIAFVIDTAHGLTSLQMVREDRSGSFKVAGKVAAGKSPVFLRLTAGRYCLYGFSVDGNPWTMNLRDGLCWEVVPGVVSYRATLQPRQYRSALNGAFGSADNDDVTNQVLSFHDPKGFLALMAAAPAPEWTAFPHDEASLVEDVAHNALILQRVGTALRNARIYDGAARMFEASFRLGRPFAATLRGDLERLAQGRKKDFAAAAEWYRLAAEAGDTRGAALHCQALDLGLTGKEDPAAAARWCRKAADGGDALGQYWLARLMARERGGLKSDPGEQARLMAQAEAFREPDPARETFRREPDAKPEDHTEKISDLVRRSFGFKAADGGYPDGAEALRVALLDSANGEASGAMLAGFYTAKGIGTTADWRRAEELYQRAARIGTDPDAFRAHNTLAHAFWEGKDGFPRDIAKALQWFNTLAQQGRDSGRANLAWFLATVDDDSVRDPVRARELIERAIKHRGGEPHGWIDTLAAALAATGDFAGARREQERALSIALRIGVDDTTISDYEGRLAKYERGVAERR